MPITVRRDGQEPQLVTMRAALRRLAAATDEGPILAALGHGQPVPVITADGAGELWQLSSALTSTARPASPTDRRYIAAGELLLAVPYNAACLAVSEQAARRIICGVLSNRAIAPDGFELQIDTEALAGLIGALRGAIAANKPHALPVDSVRLGGVHTAPLLLERSP